MLWKLLREINRKLVVLVKLGLVVVVVLFVHVASQNQVLIVHASNYVETTSYNIGFSGGDMAEDASGNIYIVDSNNSQIKKYNSNGVFQLQFGSFGSGNGQFNNATGITIDSSGNIFVADGNRVQKFTSGGTYVTQFALAGVAGGITVDTSDNLYVTLYDDSGVAKYSNSGVHIQTYGTFGSGNLQFDSPEYIKVGSDGKIYIADNGNKRVEVLDSNGQYLFEITGFGTPYSYYIMPVDIDLDPVTGDIFVSDTYNNIVKIFDNAGNPLSSFDVPGGPLGMIVKSNVVLVNTFGDIVLRRYTLDELAPTINVTPLVSDISNVGVPTFVGQASDTMSPIQSVEYRIENEGFLIDWTSCAAQDGEFNSLSESFSCIPSASLPEAAYQLSVRATDNVANREPVGGTYYSYAFSVVDDAPPLIDNTAFPNDQTYDTTPTLTGTVTDAVSIVTKVEYESTTEDPGNWYNCTAVDGVFDELSESYSCTVSNQLPVGVRQVTIRATDADGHVNEHFPGNAFEYSFEVLALTTPTVTTGAVSNISANGASIAGTVSNDGGSSVTEKGIVYSSTVLLPTTTDSKAGVASGTGPISGVLTGLVASTHYYARAFAINAQGTSYGSVVEFTTSAASPSIPAALLNVYVTFAKFKYGKYVSPTALRSGDTAYIKNYNTSKIKLIQVFLYDYAKKGNQCFTKSKVTTTQMFLKTCSLLPTGKRYAYVFKFQDKATSIIATKYFVVYTTKTWNGHSVLGVKTINSDVLAAGFPSNLPPVATTSPTPEITELPDVITELPTVTVSETPSNLNNTSKGSSLGMYLMLGIIAVAVPLLYRWSKLRVLGK